MSVPSPKNQSNNKPNISIMARILLVLQQVYKITLSPLIGRQCRYLPSCSEYAADCVKIHGAWKGSVLGIGRICRCNPFGGSGYDPAPTQINAKWYEIGKLFNQPQNNIDKVSNLKCEEIKDV